MYPFPLNSTNADVAHNGTKKTYGDIANGFYFLFQTKSLLKFFCVSGKDGFDKKLPDLNLAAKLDEHEFK